MKIQEKKADLVPFSSIEFGGVFRYKWSVAIKIYTVVSDFGNVKAISLEDGRQYTFSFDDESTLVEPLDATLVIKPKE